MPVTSSSAFTFSPRYTTLSLSRGSKNMKVAISLGSDFNAPSVWLLQNRMIKLRLRKEAISSKSTLNSRPLTGSSSNPDKGCRFAFFSTSSNVKSPHDSFFLP
ncbi:hypothetical protein AVEN_264791-1 [Araneus ventricosus]|uniref:Uncharacterized protein n=1 Tax=Araneus ventricosus TaxID=182803 RepID=A0A4Y2TY10_ARAVE|nr:hypothetical protein AVEN_264791-1 [Araneus ventricosus]